MHTHAFLCSVGKVSLAVRPISVAFANQCNPMRPITLQVKLLKVLKWLKVIT